MKRPVLDVSDLPPVALGSRAPVWWGNTLLMVIETTTVALLVISYFYLSRNLEVWPPPQVSAPSPRIPAFPDLWVSSINTILLLITAGLMLWIERAALNVQQASVLGGLLALVTLGAGACCLRYLEFLYLQCRWDENAYGSIVWGIMVAHYSYLIVGVLELALTALWIWLCGLDEKHVVDVTLMASYWYWTVAVWIVLYLVIYWSPRILSG